MKNELKNLSAKGIIVSIYTNRIDPEVFACGYIMGVDKRYVYIKHITPGGEEDGIVVRRIEKIYRIEYGGNYENRIGKLYKLKKQTHEKYNLVIGDLDNLLLLSKEQELIMTISIGSEGEAEITAIVHSVKDEKIYLCIVNINGEKDGEAIIFRNDIESINCDTRDEKDLRLLLNS